MHVLVMCNHYDSAARQKVRSLLHCCRPTTCGLGAVSTADGSALVKAGSTSVMAGARLEVMLPSHEAPDEGQVVLNIEMTPLSYADYRYGCFFFALRASGGVPRESIAQLHVAGISAAPCAFNAQ